MLIDETGTMRGRVSYDQAMFLAYEKDLDLVLVNPNPNSPVAKLMDFDKEIYQQEKAKRKQRAKQKNQELKEIKLSVKIDTHDLETKARKGKKFLDKGHKVRVLLMLRGRENLFKGKVEEVINKFKTMIDGEYEQNIKNERNKYTAIFKKANQ